MFEDTFSPINVNGVFVFVMIHITFKNNSNQDVISQCNENPSITNVRKTKVPEYDLCGNYFQSSFIKLHFTWQKGHQGKLETDEKIFDSFNLLRQIIVAMNQKAGIKLRQHTVTYKKSSENYILSYGNWVLNQKRIYPFPTMTV